jgi:multicomponent Na+:H+ antiporter subunit B
MIRSFESLMLRTLMTPLVAALQLFGAYVLLHGHYSPGGGFVAGILFAASMILPRLTPHAPRGRLALTPRGAAIMAAIGILFFAAIAVAPMLVAHAPLDYGALPIGSTAAYRRSTGILLIEVGVTLAVAGAMLSIFHALAGPLGGAEQDA